MGRLNLKDAQRRELKRLIKHPYSWQELQRAYALVWLDEGEPVARVARRLEVARYTLYRWMARIEKDPDWSARRLRDDPRPGRPGPKKALLDKQVPD